MTSEEYRVIEIREMVIKAFKALKFKEVTHTYTVKGKVYISATTCIKEFYQEFDSEFMSANVSKAMLRKKGWKIDPSFYMRRWEMIGEEANIAGSRVHEYLQYGYPDFHEPPFCRQEQAGIDFFNSLEDRYCILLQESRMFTSKYKIAGTADLLIYDKLTDSIIIGDWKTNEKTLRKSYRGTMMNSPFDDMLDTDINKYTIQTNIYQLMLEELGLKVSERWIIQLSTPSDDITDKYVLQSDIKPFERTSSYIWYKLPNMQQKLVEALEMRNNDK